MDRDDLTPLVHRSALRGLDRINLLSRVSSTVWSGIRSAFTSRDRKPGSRPLRLLDLATGGGGLPCALAVRAKSAGLSLVATGFDRSPIAIDYARQTAARLELSESISFESVDVLAEDLPRDHDIITCCLFLHHLAEEEVIVLLQRMADAARDRIVISDLIRCRPGWLLSRSVPRLVTRSSVVHVDAVRSVEAAFAMNEISGLAAKAGLSGVRLEWRWPFRFLLVARGVAS